MGLLQRYGSLLLFLWILALGYSLIVRAPIFLAIAFAFTLFCIFVYLNETETIARWLNIPVVDVSPTVKGSFWQRHFTLESNRSQFIFDILFGLVIPAFCVIFDPAIFRDGAMGQGGFLGGFKWFAYIAIPIQAISLILWLGWGDTGRLWNGFLAGILLAGGTSAVIVGVLMLPLTLIALIFLIGLLGLIPFATGLVFLRNGWRALCLASNQSSQPRFLSALVLGICFATFLPLGTQFYQWQLRPSIETMMMYPHAENTSMEIHPEMDSGTSTEQTFTFDTADASDEVQRFYNESFKQHGGLRLGSNEYSYHSFAGKSYHVVVRCETGANDRRHVTVVVRYSNF